MATAVAKPTTAFVIPAKNADGVVLRIRDPRTKAVIPEDGCEVEINGTVRMHVRQGALIDRDDVLGFKKAAAEAAAEAPAAESAPSSRRSRATSASE